jgi:hypothetical protein
MRVQTLDLVVAARELPRAAAELRPAEGGHEHSGGSAGNT